MGWLVAVGAEVGTEVGACVVAAGGWVAGWAVAWGEQAASICPRVNAPMPVNACWINFLRDRFAMEIMLRPVFSAEAFNAICQFWRQILSVKKRDALILPEGRYTFYDKISSINRKNVING